MPFAFSTLGCPGASFAEVVSMAKSVGATGVELRAGAAEIVHIGLSATQRARLRDDITNAGLTSLAVSSYVKICSDGDDADVVSSLADHLRLAHDVGAAGVRVFPGAPSTDVSHSAAAADQTAVRRLSEVVPLARELGVQIIVETHDSHPRGVDVARILHALDERIPAHPVRVIWDALHPWRAGEAPEATFAAISPWLAYVQLKDARSLPSGQLTLLGDGDAPLAEIVALLRDRPEMWWSLEWEKPWFPELAELPVALESARTWLEASQGAGEGAGEGT